MVCDLPRTSKNYSNFGEGVPNTWTCFKSETFYKNQQKVNSFRLMNVAKIYKMRTL